MTDQEIEAFMLKLYENPKLLVKLIDVLVSIIRADERNRVLKELGFNK